MNWIKTSDALPPEGRFVLCRVTRDNWRANDTDGVYYKVLCLCYGLSKADRAAMKAGAKPDRQITVLDGWGNAHETPLSGCYSSADEDGNNRRPYNWTEFGPGHYFGQEVDYWCEIERLALSTPTPSL